MTERCPICGGDKRFAPTYHMPLECPSRCGFTYTGCQGLVAHSCDEYRRRAADHSKAGEPS